MARFNHVPGGSNVLWMDGHVEFQRYRKNFPIGMQNKGDIVWNTGTDWNLGTALPQLMTVAAGFG